MCYNNKYYFFMRVKNGVVFMPLRHETIRYKSEDDEDEKKKAVRRVCGRFVAVRVHLLFRAVLFRR